VAFNYHRSLGAVSQVVDAIHSYGGLVFHDIIQKKGMRKKPAEAGVDGFNFSSGWEPGDMPRQP